MLINNSIGSMWNQTDTIIKLEICPYCSKDAPEFFSEFMPYLGIIDSSIIISTLSTSTPLIPANQLLIDNRLIDSWFFDTLVIATVFGATYGL